VSGIPTITYHTKKKDTRYKERDEEKRQAFVEEIKNYRTEDLVYVDESGVDTCIYRDKGWALKGQKVYGEVSGRKYERQSFIAGKTGSKVIAPFCFQGTCNTQVFNTWIEKVLLPTLRPGQVVIMDNASFHKSTRTRELIESVVGCKVLFLPPYSPDLNPIEKVWANFKRSLSGIIQNFKSLSNALDYLFQQFCST
jgi:transposase